MESTGILYDGSIYSKEYMTNLINADNYRRNPNFRTYSVSTTKSGSYYIVKVDVDYDYEYSKNGTFYKNGYEAHITIKLKPSNSSDIQSCKVVSCSWQGKTFDDGYYAKEEFDFEVETEIPYTRINYCSNKYWGKTNAYLFELNGSQVPKNCLKKYRYRKYYLDTWAEDTISSISTNQNNWVQIGLYFKDSK